MLKGNLEKWVIPTLFETWAKSPDLFVLLLQVSWCFQILTQDIYGTVMNLTCALSLQFQKYIFYSICKMSPKDLQPIFTGHLCAGYKMLMFPHSGWDGRLHNNLWVTMLYFSN